MNGTYVKGYVDEGDRNNFVQHTLYEVIRAEEILPQLRRSKMKVNVDVVGKTDEEILELAKSNPADLNMEEILYSATLTDNVDEQLTFYKAVV